MSKLTRTMVIGVSNVLLLIVCLGVVVGDGFLGGFAAYGNEGGCDDNCVKCGTNDCGYFDLGNITCYVDQGTCLASCTCGFHGGNSCVCD